MEKDILNQSECWNMDPYKEKQKQSLSNHYKIV
jgi:hypothetical protein